MIPQKRRYFVIIVHYGDQEDTKRAVDSLYAGDVKPDAVVVVDHGKNPFSEKITPGAKVVRPRANSGFGGGFNVGLGVLYSLGASSSDIVIGINNDVVVERGSLSELVRWWEQNPQDALVGVMVRENNNVVAGGGAVNYISGRAELNLGRALKAGRLDYVHGAFFSAPFSLFATLKGMPEHYFMYWEDVLFSFRAKRKRYPLRIATSVYVNHKHHASTSLSDESLYYLVRNGAEFMENELGLVSVWWWVWNRLRYLYHSVTKRGWSPLVREALRDALRGITGQKPEKI